jgi:hypothetical protein
MLLAQGENRITEFGELQFVRNTLGVNWAFGRIGNKRM